MASVFDTLRYSQRLQQVGVSRDQAEAHAELARDMIIADLATKLDVTGLAKDLRVEMQALRADLGAEMKALRADLGAEMKLLEQRMTIRLGLMLVGAIGIVVAAQKLL